MALKINDKAPEFTLFDQNANKVSLSNYSGSKVVLLFFPFANSSVCTTEMSQMRDDYEKYKNLDASIIGISVDSHYALKMWSEKNNFQFPLLSDFNKEVSSKYDSLFEVFSPGKYNYLGVSKRSAFVIGKDGMIKYIEICNTPGDQPDYDAIEKLLNKLN